MANDVCDSTEAELLRAQQLAANGSDEEAARLFLDLYSSECALKNLGAPAIDALVLPELLRLKSKVARVTTQLTSNLDALEQSVRSGSTELDVYQKWRALGKALRGDRYLVEVYDATSNNAATANEIAHHTLIATTWNELARAGRCNDIEAYLSIRLNYLDGEVGRFTDLIAPRKLIGQTIYENTVQDFELMSACLTNLGRPSDADRVEETLGQLSAEWSRLKANMD